MVSQMLSIRLRSRFATGGDRSDDRFSDCASL
jgi:hypothetical protein